MLDKTIMLDVKQQLREILILEYGELWFNFCEEAGISDDIRMKYIDYLNEQTDAL